MRPELYLLLVPDTFPGNGAVGRATHMMAKALVENGVRVIVLARWCSGERLPAADSSVEVTTFGHFDKRRGQSLGRTAWFVSAIHFAAHVAWRMVRGGFSGAICYGLSPLLLPAALVARVLRRPIAFVQYDLYRPTNMDNRWKQRLSRLYDVSERFLARSSRLLVLSESSLLMEKFAHLAPGVSQFTRWPPTDISYFRGGDPKRGREVCGVGPETPLIIYTGAISRLEGVDLLLEAMPVVVARHPDAVLVIAGRVVGDVFPGTMPDYHALPRHLGVEYNVRFLGLVGRETVRDLLAAADCLVMAKRDHEGNAAASPIKMGEYLASGRPVVTTRVCGVDGWLTDGMDVVFCRPGDPADLAAALLRVLRDKAGAARIGQAGQIAGRRHCDFRQWGRSFLQAWRESSRRSPGK